MFIGTRVVTMKTELKQIQYVCWSCQNLLLGFYLQLFLRLGCDSLWNRMFRIITVICEFLCIHTLLIWQSWCFFFFFSSHSPFMYTSVIQKLHDVITSLSKTEDNILFNKRILFFIFCHFRATPTTYGGSQARGHIGAILLASATATAT